MQCGLDVENSGKARMHWNKRLYLQYRSKVSWHSILEPWCSKCSRIEKQGFLEYAKTQTGFEETIYFAKEEQYSTAHTYSKVQAFRVDRYRMKTFDQKIVD